MDAATQHAVVMRAEAQDGLITRPQALRLGMAHAGIQRHVAQGRWAVAGRGVYRIGGAPQSYEQSVRAATLSCPGSVACLRSAALLYRLPIDTFEEVEIAPARRTRARRGDGLIIWQVSGLDFVDRSRLKGIPATSISRTVLDLPAVVDPKVAAKILDHVLARRLATPEYLSGRLQASGARGAGREIVARLIAERQGRRHHPDSWYQARLAEIVRGLGLEGWAEEYEVVLPDGTRRRIDLAFFLIRLALEVVSYLHRSQPVDFSADQVRNNQLTTSGWWMLYLTTYDLERDPDRVGRQILDAVARLSAPGVARGVTTA